MFNKIKQIRLIDSSINQSYQRTKQNCSAVSSDPEKDIFITMLSVVMFIHRLRSSLKSASID